MVPHMIATLIWGSWVVSSWMLLFIDIMGY